MKAVHRTTICTVFSLMMLGAAFAQHIQTDFDHQANFSQYKTYSWQQIKAATKPISLSTKPIRGSKSRLLIRCGIPELRMLWMPNWQPRAGLR